MAKPYPHRIHLSKPHMGGKELPLVQEAFETNWLSTVGPHLNALEKRCQDLWGMHCLALSSGTAAIHLGLKALGVCEESEVVVSTLTFAASANPVLYLGAKPVFIDSERESWNLDPSLLDDFLKKRARINRLPKAVEVVHIFGQSANLREILSLCREYEIPLLEDAAEALGARYEGKQVGTFGDLGVFSFNGNKIITCTGGGLLIGKNAESIEQARHWSTQARDPDPFNNFQHSQLGYNYRLSNVLAGIALGQMQELEIRVSERRRVFENYCRAFADIPGFVPMPEADWGRCTRWLSCFVLDSKARHTSYSLAQKLLSFNVEARPVWKPLHIQPIFEKYERIGGAVAEELNRLGICLPSSSNLTEDEQNYVIDCVRHSLLD